MMRSQSIQDTLSFTPQPFTGHSGRRQIRRYHLSCAKDLPVLLGVSGTQRDTMSTVKQRNNWRKRMITLHSKDSAILLEEDGMIKNKAYELITVNQAIYSREEFLDRKSALFAYARAQQEVKTGKLTSASLAKYNEHGLPYVIRQIQKDG